MKIYSVAVSIDLILVYAKLCKDGIEINVEQNMIEVNVRKVLCGTTAFVDVGVKNVV